MYRNKLEFITPVTHVGGSSEAAPDAFLRQVAVVAAGVSDTTQAGWVTSAEDLALLTSDTAALKLFEGGMTAVYFIPVRDDGSVDLTGVNLSEFYSLWLTPATSNDLLSSFDMYEGLKYVSTEIVETASDLLLGQKNTVVAIDSQSEGWLGIVIAQLLRQPWNNHQYMTLDGYAVLGSNGDWELWRTQGYTFLVGQDGSTTDLGFFVANGKAVADFYISKEIDLAVQATTRNYIAVNTPAYSDDAIFGLYNKVNKVLAGYRDVSLLIGFYDLVIDAVANQPEQKRLNFTFVGSYSLEFASAVWVVEYSVREVQ